MKSRWGRRFCFGATGITLLGLLCAAAANYNQGLPEQSGLYERPVAVDSSLFQSHLLALLLGGVMLLLGQRFWKFWCDRQQMKQALAQVEAKYHHSIEQAVVGIFQTTPAGSFLSANPALAQICGYGSVKDLTSQITALDHQLYVKPGRRREFVALMQEYGTVAKFESQIYRLDGQVVWISETARAICREDGQSLYYEGFVSDITAHKQVEAQLLHDSLHDPLTGLPNRLLFMQRLAAALNHSQTQQFAVVCVNLDRFRLVNETLGRLMGDQLLIEVSRRLHHCLRSQDTCACLGGDRFAILIKNVQDYYSIRQIVERIQQEFKVSFPLGGQTLWLSASVGSILSSPDYQEPEDLLREAEAALSRSKALGQPRPGLVKVSSMARVTNLSLATELQQAVENQEFQLHYQPIVKLRNGQVQGFEALVRWHHPQRGLIPAYQFMPMAEETGLIVPLGWWVLREACQQIKTWQARFTATHPLTMSVNLSARQFAQPDLVDQIKQILAELELNVSSLKLEVTEKIIMADPELASTKLWQLQDLGIQIAIDDFGTGYSSLIHLHHFPIQTLKIDRSFIEGVEREPEKLEMIRTMVTLAWNLDMDVIAEGVETEKQRSQLNALNCDVGQGYLFSKPLNSDAAAILLTEIDGATGVF